MCADLRRRIVPDYATSLIGREGELAALQRWMDDDCVRLMSIVGPAGVGKTRLAATFLRSRTVEGDADVVFFPRRSSGCFAGHR